MTKNCNLYITLHSANRWRWMSRSTDSCADRLPAKYKQGQWQLHRWPSVSICSLVALKPGHVNFRCCLIAMLIKFTAVAHYLSNMVNWCIICRLVFQNLELEWFIIIKSIVNILNLFDLVHLQDTTLNDFSFLFLKLSPWYLFLLLLQAFWPCFFVLQGAYN